jgi:hypothetical protein
MNTGRLPARVSTDAALSFHGAGTHKASTMRLPWRASATEAASANYDVVNRGRHRSADAAVPLRQADRARAGLQSRITA